MFNKSIFTILICLFSTCVFSQPVFTQIVTKAKREKLNAYLNKEIRDNLSLAPDSENETKWENAFYPLQLLQKKNEWIDGRLSLAFKNLKDHSGNFQSSFLTVIFANYPTEYLGEMKRYILTANDPVSFAIAAEYIKRAENNSDNRRWLLSLLRKLRSVQPENIFLNEAGSSLHPKESFIKKLNVFFRKDYLPGQVLLISLQRRNRDYPGIVLVRDTAGNFLADSSGFLFYVPQLARSISGLPYYITNGNTPQGIFRMDGFDVSRSTFIGPTQNIQMSMPFEITAAHFMKDSIYTGKELPLELYRTLLPREVVQYQPLYQSYYAGRLGRNEIIAHGTTIDEDWYSDKPWYPFTPGLGCLSTKELWDETSGERKESGQQKLVDAVIKAGGPSGYVIVIDIDDEQRPVTIEDAVNRMKE